MSLPEVSIRRPVTTLMVYIGVFLFGVISLSMLAQELFPPITYPQLSVVTPYENAAPEEIETLITKPIEEAVGGISGLRKISSTSKEGLSLVIAEFGWNQNMDFASLAIREKLDLIKERLPRDAAEPIVVKFNPFELPVMTISVSSDERTPVQLRELAKKWFKDELEKVSGVASASISGGAEEEILVDIDQARLQQAGVGINEVSDAIGAANLNYPGGTIKESFYEYLVRTLGEFKHVNEIGEIPIRREKGRGVREERPGDESVRQPTNRLILLKDVADISRTVTERTSFSRFNLRENITLSVQKQAQANTIKVANLIRDKLAELEEQLPDDIHVDIVYDQSKFIREALNGVRDAAVQGGVLAFIILLIFLKDMKNSALVVTITPVTVLATFTLMHFMGISLNVISLGGVALGVGMLVDNAVVVIENIYRKFSETPKEGIEKAAVNGANEVMAPMIASTMTTIAVFLPIVFVTGIAGQIFKQLAWVVVVTQLISLIIAFSLLPMLIVKVTGSASSDSVSFDKEDQGPPRSLLGKFLAVTYKPIAWLERTYEKILPPFIARRWFNLGIVAIIFVLSVLLFTTMDSVLLPKVDQGQFMVKVDLPVGSRLEITDRVAQNIESFIQKLPEVKSVSTIVGSSKGASSKEVLERLGANQAQILATLKPDSEKSTDEVVQDVRQYFELSAGKDKIRPARINYVLYESAFKVGGDVDAPIVIDVKGPDLNQIQALALEAQEKISLIDGVYGVTTSIAEPFPETKIIINKDRASFYRLSVVSVAQAANIAIRGISTSKFKEEGREIDIRVQLNEKDRNQFQKLGFLTVHSPMDLEVPLGDFVKFQRGKGPSEIKRIAQERTVQVYGKIFERSLKEVVEEVQAVLDTMRVPDRYSVKIAGESEEIQESFASLQFALILSIILVYMIMAAQFESLWQPFIVMFCVPLAMIGVSLSLFITGTPISVVVILGVILLGGIAVNNGIILISFLNDLRTQNVPLLDAALQAGKIRFRPILMTSFTTIIGLVPLALGLSEGAQLQAPMARAVMGGMLVATFLTLVVIPAVYVGAEVFAQRLRDRKKAQPSKT